jgi:hypothetical protein
MPAWIHAMLPWFKKRAKTPKPEDAILLAPEFLKILERRYVVIPDSFQDIRSLIDYFHVPKAEDIQPVYNGKKCGINDALWSPNFWLPFAIAALWLLDFGYVLVDIDLGEFFFNFPYPELLRQYLGYQFVAVHENFGGSWFSVDKRYGRFVQSVLDSMLDGIQTLSVLCCQILLLGGRICSGSSLG